MTTLDSIDYVPNGTLVLVEDYRTGSLTDTVIVFEGVDNLTGDTVVFGVDHRAALDLIVAIDRDCDVLVDLPDWAIIARSSFCNACGYRHGAGACELDPKGE